MTKSTRTTLSGAAISLVLGLGLAGSPWPAGAQEAPAGGQPVVPGEAPPEVMEECAEPDADPALCRADQADPSAGEAAPEPSEPAKPVAVEPAPEVEAGAEATEAEQVEEVPPANAV